MAFQIVEGNIVTMHVDAIVNAANTGLIMGSGVCGAIFRAAGAEQLQQACNPLAPIETGDAVITPGFKLPAKYVIHAAGPVYNPGNETECEHLLRSAYLRSMEVARDNRCRSIAFPLISSGIYGYPYGKALQTARSAIEDFLKQNEMEVYLVLYGRK